MLDMSFILAYTVKGNLRKFFSSFNDSVRLHTQAPAMRGLS